MKKILVLQDFYYPGFKAGGPIKSIRNIVNNLKDEFSFYIITSNKDLGEKIPFKNIKENQWNEIDDNEYVFYNSEPTLSSSQIRKIVNNNFDCIYVNSFFSKNSIKLLFLLTKLKVKKNKIILAPRGEFSPGALNIKKIKKITYIKISKMLKLYKNVSWHFTDYKEKDYVETYFKVKDYYIIPNLIQKSLPCNPHKDKNKNELKLIFLSRISPKKNIDGALKILSKIKNINITYDIFGPISDKIYFEKLKGIINELPNNIKVNFKGPVNPNHLKEIFINYDLFFFPTLGENFGHAIMESLSYGTPVLISDQTPWNDIENKNAGRAFNLKNEILFENYIREIAMMDDKEFKVISTNAFNYYKNFEKKQNNYIEKYKEMFSK